MDNFISENISFLVKKNNFSLDDFGALFDLSKGLTGQYVRKLSLPKIVTIQKICLHFKITIDDFVNTDLSAGKSYGIQNQKLLKTNDANPDPYVISPRYVEVLEKALEDKEKIIKALEEKLGMDKSHTA